MKAIDNSNLCGECTGSGWACGEPCKVCMGTGVEPEKKDGKTWLVIDDMRHYIFSDQSIAMDFQKFWNAPMCKAI